MSQLQGRMALGDIRPLSTINTRKPRFWSYRRQSLGKEVRAWQGREFQRPLHGAEKGQETARTTPERRGKTSPSAARLGGIARISGTYGRKSFSEVMLPGAIMQGEWEAEASLFAENLADPASTSFSLYTIR